MAIINACIEVFSPKMAELVDLKAPLVRLYAGSKHTEGPVYLPTDGSIVWSDVKGDHVLRLHENRVSVLRAPAHYQNGNAVDLEGRIVACSHGDRAIVRQEKDGHWHILADSYQGKRLNSPNDIVVKSDGTIWFTDPPFGLTQPEEGCGGEQEQPGSFVFRFDPATGDISAVITNMMRPNGLAFSPDERLLYVSDTSAYERPDMYHDILVYRVVDGLSAVRHKVFAVVSPGQPDGICIDAQGNVFTSAQDGIHVYSPAGQRLGKIAVPEVCSNLTFGCAPDAVTADKNRLFVTAGGSLYAIDLKTRGL